MSISNLCSSSHPRVIQNVAGLKLKKPSDVTTANDGKSDELVVFGKGSIATNGKWEGEANGTTVTIYYQIIGGVATIEINGFSSLSLSPQLLTPYLIGPLPNFLIPSNVTLHFPMYFRFSSSLSENYPVVGTFHSSADEYFIKIIPSEDDSWNPTYEPIFRRTNLSYFTQ